MKKVKSNKIKKPTKVDLPDVALNSPTTVENLPHSKVHYPNHYGIFITFSFQQRLFHSHVGKLRTLRCM